MRILIAILLFIPYVAFSQSSEPILFPLFTFPAGSSIDPLELSTNDSVIIVSNICQNESFKVLGFVAGYTSGSGDIIDWYNYGNKFNPETIAIFKQLPINSRVYCDHFMVFTGTDTLISAHTTMFRTDGLKACIYAFPKEVETGIRTCLDSSERRTIGKEPIKISGFISRENLSQNTHILVADKETDDSPIGINIDYQIVQYDIILVHSKGFQISKISVNGDAIPKKERRCIKRNRKIREVEIIPVVASDADGHRVKAGSLRLTVM